MQTYFRLHPSDEDPRDLLDPEQQWTRPWGDDEAGKPCDKCGGSGRTLQKGPEVPVDRTCPACEGSGRINNTRRRGVSVFRRADDLYRYMERRNADVAGCRLVELRGEPSADEDFDADEGALLVLPTEIVSVREVDGERATVEP